MYGHLVPGVWVRQSGADVACRISRDPRAVVRPIPGHNRDDRQRNRFPQLAVSEGCLVNSKNRTLIIVIAAIVLIVGLAGIAVLLSGGDDSNESSVPAPVSTDADGQPVAAADIEDIRPVEVTGDPLPPYDPAVADPTIGTPAPVISGQSFDGSPITIGGATGRPTMLVFLAHWCPHCNAEIPELIELQNAGAIPEGVDVIGISTGVAPKEANYPPSEWIAEKGWPWPVLADDADSTAFLSDGGSGFPYTVLLDADGKVLSRASGSRAASDISVWLNGALG
jgi:cytochrome c biogenesis protein CcmG/thiol:disulfide interchange protein DsbE